MRTLLLILSTLLCACAVPETHPARITIGALTHRVEPPSSSIAGYRSVEFPVRLTNTAKQPIWFYAQFRESPFHNTYSRPTSNSRWTIQTQPMCGVGADFHKLEPGASISFKAWVPRDAAHEFRVELPIYRSPDNKTKPLNLSSEAISIK